MDMIEQAVNTVLADYEARKLRLWLVNFRDAPVDLGQWAGLILLRAEAYPNEWKPDRRKLLEQVRTRCGNEGVGLSPESVTETLLGLTRDQFAADLTTKGVPREIARRAGEMLSFQPPVQQWRM